MSQRRTDAPRAFLDFAQGFRRDARDFETRDECIRFCLRHVRRDQVSNFIAFAEQVERGEFTTSKLEKLLRTDTEYVVLNDGIRWFMRRAREIAEREGGDGSLHATRASVILGPRLKPKS